MWEWPNYIQYRMALRRQSRAQKKLDQARPADTEEVHESGQMAAFHYEDERLYEWKCLIQTRYYTRKSDSLLVQMPDVDDPQMYGQVEWDNDHTEPKYLTNEGLRVIRAAIREEQKHRREAAGYWFGIVVGLIGAATGLVSVFKG